MNTPGKPLISIIAVLPYFRFMVITGILAGLAGCESHPNRDGPVVVWDTLTVTASAYNSLRSQTEGNPNITAWGDTIAPGDKIIAVSRDLERKGLDYETKVMIEGFDGIFEVRDKMHYRWRNKIDIYMGEDVKRARKFGRKKLEIYYQVFPDSLNAEK